MSCNARFALSLLAWPLLVANCSVSDDSGSRTDVGGAGTYGSGRAGDNSGSALSGAPGSTAGRRDIIAGAGGWQSSPTRTAPGATGGSPTLGTSGDTNTGALGADLNAGGAAGSGGGGGTAGIPATGERAGAGGASGTDADAGTGGPPGTGPDAAAGGTSGTDADAGTAGIPATDADAGTGGPPGTDPNAVAGGTTGTGASAGAGGTTDIGASAGAGGTPDTGGDADAGGWGESGGSSTGGTLGVDCNATMPTSGAQEYSTTFGEGGSGNLAWQVWTNGDLGYLTTYDGIAAFTARWDESGDYLARVGFDWQGSAQPYGNYGTITAQYVWNKSGTAGQYSYIGLYGWSDDPCVEWYIIEDSFHDMPFNTGSLPVATAAIDDGTYDLVRLTTSPGNRCPGFNTLHQYYSVRSEGKRCGSITVSDHFAAWAAQGWDAGNLQELRFVVEAAGGSGQVDFPVANVMTSQ